MRDKTALIECRGGLNESVSELNVGAGEVRRSLNYEQVAEGGYRLIGGTRKWSGIDVTPRIEAITVIEVQPRMSPTDTTFSSISTFNATSTGTTHTLFEGIARADSTLIVTERESATAEFVLGEEIGFNSQYRIVDLEPELTESEQLKVINAVDYRNEGAATRPNGNADIVLIHGHKIEGEEKVFVVRMEDERFGHLQYANSNFALPGTWTAAGTINQPGNGRWFAYSYLFEGNGNYMFIVNGTMNVHYLRDGQVLGQIFNGVPGFPTHVIVHKNHLFLAYPGGRIVHSDIGNPLFFSAATGGAGELGFGEEITGFQILPGNSLAIFGRDRIGILSGDDATTWQLDIHTDESGAIEGSIQNLPTTIFADRRGITTLNASDHYGNFRESTLSHRFHPLYTRIMNNNTLFSSVNRDKSQYRFFNQDGSGMHLTFTSGALVGGMEVDLKKGITSMATIQHENEDVVYFGDADGWVYRMDAGERLDGFPMSAFLEFPFHHYNSPRQKKNFKEVVLDMEGDPRTKVNVTNSVDRGEPFNCDATPVVMETRERTKPGYLTAVLSRFRQRFRGVAYIIGTGFDQALLINEGHRRHTINSITVHYTWRGQKK